MSETQKDKNNAPMIDNMANTDIAAFKEAFESIEVYLSVFELNPEDPIVIEEVRDGFKKIYDYAYCSGLDSLAGLADCACSFLDGITSGSISADNEIVEIIFKSAEFSGRYLSDESPDEDEVDAFVDSISHHIKNDGSSAKSSTSGSADAPWLNPELAQSYSFFKFNAEQNVTTVFESIDQLLSGYDTDAVDALIRAMQGLHGASSFINHEEMAMISAHLEDELMQIKPDTLPEQLNELIDEIKNFAEGLQSFINSIEVPDPSKQEEPETVEIPGSQAAAASGISAKKDTKDIKSSKTMRIPVEKINDLMNSVEELIILNSKISKIRDDMASAKSMSNHAKAIAKIYSHFEKNSEHMYNEMLSMRMSPVKSLFNKFKSVIEDISRDQGKNIFVHISGEETEVDRLVLETLKDPLIHLIRNAVDHGIEHSDVRVSLGKPARGTVSFRAFNDVNSVVIKIEDDGKGMDPARIKSKAIEKGLITAEQSETMSEREILDLIFQPGFSTAEQITNISGRGVGMDVVKTSIKSMNGKIEIDTQPGRGTCFSIRLPLAMTIIDALVLKAGSEFYSIPSEAVERILRIPASDFRSIIENKVLPLEKKTLPYCHLFEILAEVATGCPADPPQKIDDKKTYLTLIINNGNSTSALGVDEIIGKQKLVVKNLGQFLKAIPGISGASIQGDGTVMLMLDGPSICKLIRTPPL